jgi:hypothetical protein
MRYSLWLLTILSISCVGNAAVTSNLALDISRLEVLSRLFTRVPFAAVASSALFTSSHFLTALTTCFHIARGGGTPYMGRQASCCGRCPVLLRRSLCIIRLPSYFRACWRFGINALFRSFYWRLHTHARSSTEFALVTTCFFFFLKRRCCATWRTCTSLIRKGRARTRTQRRSARPWTTSEG